MGAEEDELNTYKLEVRVVDPLSFSSPFRPSHTTFCIQIKTNHPSFSLPYSEVRRSYSEFKWLRKVLQRHHPENEVTAIPSVGFLTWNKFTPEFLESRRLGLEAFLNNVIDVPVYLGEKALHLFIQTGLSTKDIELNLLGKRNDQIVPLELPPAPSTQALDVDINRSRRDPCYAEDALTLILDDGYCSADKDVATFLVSNGYDRVEEVTINISEKLAAEGEFLNQDC